ncbi:MAG: hypothetical protein GQ470_04460 [Gammaproteobacteria bacterium]|nr:hypothetical protein [Gammaproteobacteria bacterium]
MRFFLSAPLFGIAAGLVLLFGEEGVLINRWSTDTLVAVHMITLGVISMIMIGAVQQLLPVLMGVVIPRADMVSKILHLLWSLGTLLLVTGIALQRPVFTTIGVGLLAIATLLFVVMILYSLIRSDSKHGTLTAIGASVLSLLITLLLMLWILNSSSWMAPVAHPLTNLHMSWGILGWFLLLLIGVAYQVVPMFQITPEFPPLIRQYLALAIFVALFVWSGGEIFYLPWLSWLAIVVFVVALALYASIVLWLQQQRKRRLPDITLNYWRVSMIALLVSMVLWLVGYLSGEPRWMESGVTVFIMGGVLSAVSGMLFKIVPFLVWLHLNNLYQSAGAWQGNVPNVRQVIPERYSRWQFRAQMIAMGILMMIPLGQLVDEGELYLTKLAGIAWMASFALLLVALIAAHSRYQQGVRALSEDKPE